MQHSVLADDALINELLNLSRLNRCECFGFDPFGEIVDSYYSVLNATSSLRELAN